MFELTLYYIIALKQHNLRIERNINHLKGSNQHYLKLNVDQYFKSINSIDMKIVLNQYLLMCHPGLHRTINQSFIKISNSVHSHFSSASL
jgi:hypothetical protein